MKNTTFKQSVSLIASVGIVVLSFSPVLADTSATVSTNASIQTTKTGKGLRKSGSSTSANRMANLNTRGDQEIDKRVASLDKLNTRVQSIVHLSASEKSMLEASIQSVETNLTNLKAKIDADTDTTTRAADVKSITASIRVYALVIPQTLIAAAADRVQTITSIMTTLSAKLQTRLNDAPAGTNSASISASITDLNGKITDANTQAVAATSEVINLTPDNGDTAKATANTAALKDARSKIQIAVSDLKAARQDISSIVKALKIKVAASSTASTS